MATRFIDKVTTPSTTNTPNLPDAVGICYDTTNDTLVFNAEGTLRQVPSSPESAPEAGAGIAGAETYESSVVQNGGIITTTIVVDLTDLVGSATDLDIIGDSAAASANFGQITAAVNGTPIAGSVQCLEVPAGGADDIDFYSSTVGTGTQDVAITDAALGTETALVTSGAAWTSGATKGMTSLPSLNDYLYIVNGEAVGGTFTAGKFVITILGAA